MAIAMNYAVQRAIEALPESGVPEHMHDGVINYLRHGLPPGGFLTAVMENDLVGAFARADQKNAAAMQEWAAYLYAYVPVGARGKGSVELWCAAQQATR